MSTQSQLRALERRLNAMAYEPLCAEIARLDALVTALQAENEELRSQLAYADDCAERWRDDALQAINNAGAEPGLTVDGRLVACPPAGLHA